jgi:hypothetical protein
LLLLLLWLWSLSLNTHTHICKNQHPHYTQQQQQNTKTEFKGAPGTALHLWSGGDAWTSFTAHSNPDATYSGTLSLQTGGFDALQTPADYEAVLRGQFSGLPAGWVAPIAAQVAGEAAAPAGVCVFVAVCLYVCSSSPAVCACSRAQIHQKITRTIPQNQKQNTHYH